MTESAVRLAAVAGGLPDRKLDALLVWNGPNVRYLSGFTGENAALLVLPGKTVLFTDPRFQIQAAQEVECQLRIAKGPLVMEILAAIRRLRLGLLDTPLYFAHRVQIVIDLAPVTGSELAFQSGDILAHAVQDTGILS